MVRRHTDILQYQVVSTNRLFCWIGLSLSQLDMEAFKKHFQISEESPMVGVASRVELLNRVGSSLSKLTDIFGQDGRPGNMVGEFYLCLGYINEYPMAYVFIARFHG